MVHSKYKHPYIGFKLTAIYVSSYIPLSSLEFLPCGTKVPSFILFQGDMASFRASDSIAINAMTSMRWTRSPPHQESNAYVIGGVSERIRAVHHILSPINHKPSDGYPTNQMKPRVSLREEGASRPFIHNRTIIARRRFKLKQRTIAIVHRDEA